MPCYVYKDKDGNKIEKNVPISERDNQPGLTRVIEFSGMVWAPHTPTGYA